MTQKQFETAMFGIADNWLFVDEMDDALLLQAARLSDELAHPFYDCVYVGMAKLKKLPFLTADKRLSRKIAGFKDVEVIELMEAYGNG